VEQLFLVLYQLSAKIDEVPTIGEMLYTFAECKKKFGSPYQIEKAIADGCLWKLGAGEYSDTGDEDELEIVQWRHPNAVMTLDSAFFYHDLTDSVPDFYYMATDRGARPIADPLVKQFYLPKGTAGIGVTTIDYCGDKVRTFDLERLLVETARMKNKLAPDLYKEVVLSFRRRSAELEAYKIADYLAHFAKRDAIEKIIYEEVF
jgi:predicted transcriptional regulator of viral defense system